MLGELTREQIEDLLKSQFVGRIGSHVEGETYIIPVTYAYENNDVYIHSSEGKKISMMRANHAVCFEIEHLESMGQWQTVVAQGTFEELHGEEALHGIKLITSKLSPVIISETIPSGHEILKQSGAFLDLSKIKAVVFRIRLHKKTGRYEKRQ
jgi:uncharacterized protein